jgi:pimeloyl-ACP methyl ester carboxylesterase
MGIMKVIKAVTLALLGAGGIVGGLAAFGAMAARNVERRVPPVGGFVDVEGARLHYVDQGSGPPIVLVHGLHGQLRHFTYGVTERLLHDHRVITLDRPGSGYSTFMGAGSHGLQAQAAIIGRFIEALKLEKPLLVGHSLGGALALTVALQSPKLLGGLALVSPLTQPVETLPAVFESLFITSRRIRRLVATTLAVPLGKLKGKRTLAAIFAPDEVPEGFADAAGGLLAGRPDVFYAASTEVTEGRYDVDDIVADYPNLMLPTAILFGRSDAILSPELHGGKTVGMIPGAELKVIDGGHMLPITAPDAVAEWLLEQARRVRT